MSAAPLRVLVAAESDPPVGNHLGVARIGARAEGEVLDAVRACLDGPHRVLRDPDRVPLAELHDLVLDLDPRRALDDDVDLFLVRVLVAEGHSEVRVELHMAHAQRLARELAPAKPRLELVRHPELRGLILDVFLEVRLRVVGHAPDSRSDSTVGSSSRRVGRTSRQVHCAGSLSERKRISFVPCRKRFPCTLS